MQNGRNTTAPRNTCVSVCVGGQGMGYNRAVRVTGVESGVDGISGLALLSFSPPRSVPSEGDTGRAVYRVTVWVLSWIYNSGECFMSFSPPTSSLLQPHAPFAAFLPPTTLAFIPGYTITALHTRGCHHRCSRDWPG